MISVVRTLDVRARRRERGVKHVRFQVVHGSRAEVRIWPTSAVGTLSQSSLMDANRPIRKFAGIEVFDSRSHGLIASQPVGLMDRLFYDSLHHRIYASGGQGYVAVYQQLSPNHYAEIARVPTGPIARTSLWVRRLDRYCKELHRGLSDGISNLDSASRITEKSHRTFGHQNKGNPEASASPGGRLKRCCDSVRRFPDAQDQEVSLCGRLRGPSRGHACFCSRPARTHAQ